jgi:hypothetical protein
MKFIIIKCILILKNLNFEIYYCNTFFYYPFKII